MMRRNFNEGDRVTFVDDYGNLRVGNILEIDDENMLTLYLIYSMRPPITRGGYLVERYTNIWKNKSQIVAHPTKIEDLL